MQKKTEYEPGDIKIEEQDIHYEQEDDLPWNNDRRDKPFSRTFTKSPLSIIAICAGVLAMIIVCLFLIIPWKSGDEEPLSPATPPGQYQKRQAELIEINQRLKTLDVKYQNIELFKVRLDDLEQALALRLNQMEKKLDDIQTSFDQSKRQIEKKVVPTPQQPAPPPKKVVIKDTPKPKVVIKDTPKPKVVIKDTPKPAVVIKDTPKPTPVLTPKPKIKAPAPKIKAPAPKFSRKHYHKVIANETLFSISRRYKMKVDELRALNKMNKSDKIQLGQILIVNLPESD